MEILYIHGLNPKADIMHSAIKQYALETGCNLIQPAFPSNISSVTYHHWKETLEQYVTNINLSNCVVVASGLGNLFATKYLIENKQKVLGFIAVSGALDFYSSTTTPQTANIAFDFKLTDYEKYKHFKYLAPHRYSIISNNSFESVSENAQKRFADYICSTKILKNDDSKQSSFQISSINNLLNHIKCNTHTQQFGR